MIDFFECHIAAMWADQERSCAYFAKDLRFYGIPAWQTASPTVQALNELQARECFVMVTFAERRHLKFEKCLERPIVWQREKG